MRHLRLRFRLQTLLIIVAIMAVTIASGVKRRRVGAICEATSMPGAPGFEIPSYQEGWLVRLIRSLFPAPAPLFSTPTPTTRTRTRP